MSNTFAVDPDFRVSYAHNWQVSVQRDLPASLTVIATYLGTKGSHLMQEFVPNTYPLGAVNPCASCPSGFVYLASNGSSLKNAAQLQVRRRLRQGLMAVANYTFSKATDNAAAFTTADLNGGVIAQNWLDLDAERAPSAFDQRHLLTAQVEYAGSAFLRNWVFTSQLTRRQRPAVDAAVSHVACRHRSDRSAACELHRRARRRRAALVSM